MAKRPRLTPEQALTAGRLERCLGVQWANDAGKWIGRARSAAGKAARVAAELDNAQREGRINTTPAQYAEQIWKEFA